MAYVSLRWITPDAETLIVQMARVSTTMKNDDNDQKLLQYLIKHQHWSPFEMASACFYIESDRATSRQILRHRSFSFQEFSQRYSEIEFDVSIPARVDAERNRQSSVETTDAELQKLWNDIKDRATGLYMEARMAGVAKEVARAVAPEGLSKTRMFMSGTLRSWKHYCDLRTQEDTQKEHRDIAVAINNLLADELPSIFKVIE